VSYAGYASKFSTLAKLTPIVGAGLGMVSDFRRDSRISTLERETVQKEDVEKLCKDFEKELNKSLEKCINKVGREIILNRGRINESIQMINSHEERLYKSDKFRKMVEEVVDNVLLNMVEVVQPDSVEDVDETSSSGGSNISNLRKSVKALKDLNNSIDEKTERIQEEDRRICKKGKRS
jgi:histone H3/H4